MALGDKTHIGYTEGGLINKINNDLTVTRESNDILAETTINNEIIIMDANSKTISDRHEASIILAASELSSIKQNRLDVLGIVDDSDVPAIKLGTKKNVTQKIQDVVDFYQEKKTYLAGVESISSMTAKKVEIETLQPQNELKLNTIDPDNLSDEIDTFKELYDKITHVDLNDSTTLIGFENMMNKSLARKAQNGEQTRGNCLVYKDEVTKSFYEMYISNGLIALEEVYNPDKDIINSYLNVQDIEHIVIPAFGAYPTINKDIIKLPNDLIAAVSVMVVVGGDQTRFKTLIKLFKFDSITKNLTDLNVSYVQNTETVLTTQDFTAKPIIKSHGSNILVYFAPNNPSYNFLGTIPYQSFGITESTINENSVFNFISSATNISTLGKFGFSSNNSSYYAMTESNTRIKLFNGSGTFYGDINVQPSKYLFTNLKTGYNLDVTNTIVMDTLYLFNLEVDSLGKVYISKYNLSDLSFIDSVQILETSSIGLNISIVGDQICYYDVGTQTVIFLNKDLVKYTNTNLNFGPFVVNTTNLNQSNVVIKDIGNEKFMFMRGGTLKIFSYDGYLLYSVAEGYQDSSAFEVIDETAFFIPYLSSDANNSISKIISKPIYKFK